MHQRTFVVFALLVALFAFPIQAVAQKINGTRSPLVSRPVQIGENQATVTFAELGYRDADLVSPYDSTRVLFSIPANWKLVAGSEVNITYDIVLSGADVNKVSDTRNPYGGAMSVTFNDVIIGSIPIDTLGTQTVRFTLPANALVTQRQDGRHVLAVLLNAQFSCVYDIRALIAIKDSSFFNLVFEASSPALDLSRLPTPFYMRNSLLPDATLVVVPDKPSTMELQSALNVFAGFGSMISDEYQLDLVNVSQLTEAQKSSSNLVFVGRPDDLDILSEITFPLTIASGEFVSLPGEAARDGILQMALSPWNPSKVVLLVSGVDEQGVAKAAQAVSSGSVFVFENPALAYVSGVQSMATAIPVVEDFTLESLGYTTQTLNGIGLNSAEFLFNAAKEQVAGKGGYVDLSFYHSGLLNYGVSSLSITLNDQVIGSAVYNKDSEKLTNLRLSIPPGVLRYGENRLSINTSLLAETSCDTSGFSDPWLVISDQTGLHLPPGVPEPSSGVRTLDLKFFPGMFMTQSDLGDVAFVLPQASLTSWRVAGKLAYELGWEANPLISNLKVAYADDVDSKIRDENSLILVGMASDLPVLHDFNAMLPAPFDLKANTASEADMQVIYRIPPGVSVGYLQLMFSPFNIQKLLLVASGNDDIGLAMAGTTLTQGPLQGRLAGQFAVTNGVQVATGSVSSSQFSVVGTVIPNAEQVVATPINPISLPATGIDRPAWLTYLPIASAVLIFLVLVYVVVLSVVRRRDTVKPRVENERTTQPRDWDDRK